MLVLQTISAVCIVWNHKDVSNVAKIVFHLLLTSICCSLRRGVDLVPNLVSILATFQILALWVI